jgi:Fe-S-cluster containining protein
MAGSLPRRGYHGAVQFHWLNFHVTYACRDSGACCSSGWPIPVEVVKKAGIESAISARTIPLRVEPWLIEDGGLPEDFAGLLALRDNGHCVFFEADGPGCAIHSTKPAACVHFPYVCLIDPRGIRVTLSHYCPTAVSMLFEHHGPIEVVEGPSPVGDLNILEGLDARESLPPTFAEASTFAKASADKTVGKPGGPEKSPRLMSWDEFSAWEREQIAGARIDVLQADDVAFFDHARAAVPPPYSWAPAPAELDGAWWSLVAPAWPKFDEVLQRYAAAKIFASWAAYQDEGLAAITRVARIAAAVVRIEAARQCLQTGQPLDPYLMAQAIRQSDLLLVHYADPERLASSNGLPRIEERA